MSDMRTSCARIADMAFVVFAYDEARLFVNVVTQPLFTVRKSECSKQAFAVNVLAWNNRIGLGSILLVCWD